MEFEKANSNQMFNTNKAILVLIFSLVLTVFFVKSFAQNSNDEKNSKPQLIPPPFTSPAEVYAGTSGAGYTTDGDGSGGWRSGSEGVYYKGKNPKKGWLLDFGDFATGSAIKNGLLPPVKPLLELHLRDTIIRPGGDGNYYMTGSSGDNIWDRNDGVELWRSKDLKKWDYLGLVWSIEKDGTWEKQWRELHGKLTRNVWAPEIHYIKKNYYITLSMAPGKVGILKSVSGKPEGPYIEANPANKPLASGIDATLFEDTDGKIYFTWGSATRIALVKDDLSGFAETPRTVTLAEPDHDARHHAAKCMTRGSNDIGHEGAVLFKANGKYYLGAADDWEGRYSSILTIADNIYGPYRMRHEAVPTGGGTNYFRDKKGNWWCALFGNDAQSNWREKPAIVKIEFEQDGRVRIAEKQPKWNLFKNDRNIFRFVGEIKRSIKVKNYRTKLSIITIIIMSALFLIDGTDYVW
jgi:xylan 1,4-beta-xylosidase